jgi:hypothetical protein
MDDTSFAQVDDMSSIFLKQKTQADDVLLNVIRLS